MKREKYPFRGINHGKHQIDLTHLKVLYEVRPIEVHMNENGSIMDRPTLAFIFANENRFHIVGQISVDMLNEGLKDIGYKMIKDED